MKVLFVSSGNSQAGISPIIFNQGESLESIGVSVDYFTIVGKGIFGYLLNIPKLYRYKKKHGFDIVHVHYSLSAFVASLAGCKPLVVSLMGSDVKSKGWTKVLIRFFNAFFWKVYIVKSVDMNKSLGIENAKIIPNGVNFELLHPMDRNKALQELAWDMHKKHILFAANPKRPEKNYKLAKKAFQLLRRDDVELHFLQDVLHSKMPLYFAASNVAFLTSLWEGSPNVVKEAMACNCPVVATNVGDVQWLFGNEPGYFITGFKREDVVKQINLALDFDEKYGRTNGRQRIKDLGLDAKTVAHKIVDIYNKLA